MNYRYFPTEKMRRVNVLLRRLDLLRIAIDNHVNHACKDYANVVFNHTKEKLHCNCRTTRAFKRVLKTKSRMRGNR